MENTIINNYKAARQLYKDVMDKEIGYIGENKLTFHTILEALDKEGILDEYSQDELELDFHREIDFNFLVDLLTCPQHHCFQSVNETFLKEHYFEEQEKMDIVKAIQKSRLGIYEFVKRDNVNAIAIFKDFFTNELVYINDLNLGKYLENDNNYLITRLIRYNDVCMTSGIVMPFPRNSLIKKWIKNHKSLLQSQDQAGFLVLAYDFYIRYGLPVNLIHQ